MTTKAEMQRKLNEEAHRRAVAEKRLKAFEELDSMNQLKATIGRARKAEAERDRYRKALQQIADRGCQAKSIRHLLPSEPCSCVACIAARAIY